MNLSYDFHWATLMSATSYGRFNLHFIHNLTNANLAPGFTYGDLLSGIYGQPTLIVGDQVEFVHKFNQELRLTSDPGNTLFGHGFDWQVGGFFTHESTTLTQPYNALDASDPSTVLTPARRRRHHTGRLQGNVLLRATSPITSIPRLTWNWADAGRT